MNNRIIQILAVLVLTLAARAQGPLYSLGHGDIRISYKDGVLSQNYRLDAGARVAGEPSYSFSGDTIWAPDELITFIPNITVARPPGAEWDFLGNAEGEPLWYIPETAEGDRPWLGTSSETLVFTDWTSLRIRLSAMTGPAGGHCSLFDSGLFDGGTPKVATSDGITAADEFVSNIGSHAHLNWMFTKPGRYELTLLITGEHITDGTKTSTATYHIQIGEAPPATLVETGSALTLDIGDVTVKGIGPADVDEQFFHRTAFRLTFSGTGTTAANDTGIVLQEFGTNYLRIREGDTLADDTSVRFASFSDPTVDDLGALTFTARLAGGGVSTANDEALARTDENGATTLIAREGATAPGLDGHRYGRVKWFIAAPNGVLTFCASVKLGDVARTAVWRSIRGGAPRLVAATGQPLAAGGKIITVISMPTLTAGARDQSRAANSSGLLTLRISYKGGTHALVTFPSPLP